jgi:hypothetical protein
VSKSERNGAMPVDYGEPLGLCEETGAQTGRYVREWYVCVGSNPFSPSRV